MTVAEIGRRLFCSHCRWHGGQGYDISIRVTPATRQAKDATRTH